MPKTKKISKENYARKRGWGMQTSPLSITTATGKGFDEYFKILNLGLDNSHAGYVEYLKRVQELKDMQGK
jgi:hypothetical protein